jgi:hypothetical protein
VCAVPISQCDPLRTESRVESVEVNTPGGVFSDFEGREVEDVETSLLCALERCSASEPDTSVTSRGQFDLPVDITTCLEREFQNAH